MARLSSVCYPTIALAVCLGVHISAAAADSSAKKGRQVAEKLNANYSGFEGETFSAELIIKTRSGEVTRKLSGQTLEMDNDGDRLLLDFHHPPDVEGTKVLTWTRMDGDNDQWIYLPSSRSVRRITGRNIRSSFMGSEFSYEDLTGDEVPAYTYKYRGEDTFQGRKAWVIERYPVSQHTGYTKHVVWVDQEYHAELKIDFYDRRDERLKTFIFTGHRNVDNRGWRPTQILAGNHQNQHRTIWRFNDHRLGVNVNSRDFRPDGLED